MDRKLKVDSEERGLVVELSLIIERTYKYIGGFIFVRVKGS